MRHNTTAGHDGPTHWEHDESFQQIMAEQLRRAPWLGLSVLAHVIVGLLLATFWQPEEEPEDARVIQATPEDRDRAAAAEPDSVATGARPRSRSRTR